MRYTVIEESDCDRLARKVEGLLNEGWELYGNLLLVSHEEHSTFYAQALVNDEEPEDQSPLAGQLLDFLTIPEDQLPSEAIESRKEIARILQEALKGMVPDEE